MTSACFLSACSQLPAGAETGKAKHSPDRKTDISMDKEGEEKCQSGEKEETLKHQNGMFEEKKRMEKPQRAVLMTFIW